MIAMSDPNDHFMLKQIQNLESLSDEYSDVNMDDEKRDTQLQ
jgi:hypothetical protein